MGSASPPPPRPTAVRPPPEGEAAARTTASSRFHFAERNVPMGPSGASILLTIAAIAVGLWLYLRPPGEIGPQALQRYVGFESNMEAVVLRNCAPPGCAAVYLTPTLGSGLQDALPHALSVAEELQQQGIEFFIVFGEQPLIDAVKRAHSVRRPVVFDPDGEWARESGIEKAPYWIAWRTGGKIRLRSREPISASQIEAAIR